MAADRQVMRAAVLFCALALASCAHSVPVDSHRDDPAAFAADCRAIYQQELGREPDPDGLLGCENQIIAAKLLGAPVPQEVFRQWLRLQPEWAQHQEASRVVTLPRLVVRGEYFGLENGQPFYGIEATDFNLFGRYLSGEDIGPVIAQRQALGFNLRRVFTRYDIAQFGIGRLRLDEHPDLYDKLPAFLQLLAKSGAYANVVAYTGPYTEGFDRNHWTRLCQAVQGSTNVILSLVNENDQGNNRLDPSLFAPCPNVPSSRGSMGAGAWPVLPLWDWTEFHTNGLSEWQRRVGHEAQEIAGTYHLPVHSSETTRYPDNESSIERARGAAQASALLNAAATFHSVHGKNSTLFEGVELDAARAWVDGARTIPLSCQGRPYTHGQREIDEESAGGWLRVYRRGSDPASLIRWVCVARVPR